MDPQIIQNLRYKLQKRVRRLNSVGKEHFVPSLCQFWAFFDENPTFVGITELLLAKYPEVPQLLEKIQKGESQFGEKNEEFSKTCYYYCYWFDNESNACTKRT